MPPAMSPELMRAMQGKHSSAVRHASAEKSAANAKLIEQRRHQAKAMEEEARAALEDAARRQRADAALEAAVSKVRSRLFVRRFSQRMRARAPPARSSGTATAHRATTKPSLIRRLTSGSSMSSRVVAMGPARPSLVRRLTFSSSSSRMGAATRHKSATSIGTSTGPGTSALGRLSILLARLRRSSSSSRVSKTAVLDSSHHTSAAVSLYAPSNSSSSPSNSAGVMADAKNGRAGVEHDEQHGVGAHANADASFDAIPRNRSGDGDDGGSDVRSIVDVSDYLIGHGGIPLPQVPKVLLALDHNGDGVIDRDEWRRGWQSGLLTTMAGACEQRIHDHWIVAPVEDEHSRSKHGVDHQHGAELVGQGGPVPRTFSREGQGRSEKVREGLTFSREGQRPRMDGQAEAMGALPPMTPFADAPLSSASPSSPTGRRQRMTAFLAASDGACHEPPVAQEVAEVVEAAALAGGHSAETALAARAQATLALASGFSAETAIVVARAAARAIADGHDPTAAMAACTAALRACEEHDGCSSDVAATAAAIAAAALSAGSSPEHAELAAAAVAQALHVDEYPQEKAAVAAMAALAAAARGATSVQEAAAAVTATPKVPTLNVSFDFKATLDTFDDAAVVGKLAELVKVTGADISATLRRTGQERLCFDAEINCPDVPTLKTATQTMKSGVEPLGAALGHTILQQPHVHVADPIPSQLPLSAASSKQAEINDALTKALAPFAQQNRSNVRSGARKYVTESTEEAPYDAQSLWQEWDVQPRGSPARSRRERSVGIAGDWFTCVVTKDAEGPIGLNLREANYPSVVAIQPGSAAARSAPPLALGMRIIAVNGVKVAGAKSAAALIALVGAGRVVLTMEAMVPSASRENSLLGSGPKRSFTLRFSGVSSLWPRARRRAPSSAEVA